ncbi:Pycsar system effector family protein (plasmid) [Streptomyces sp. LZ34]
MSTVDYTANLIDARNRVASDLGRTDSKASILLAFQGAALAGIATLADKPIPTPGRYIGAAAVAALVASTVLLLLVVRPRIGGANGHDQASFPYWATCTPEQIRTSLADLRLEHQTQVLSQIACRKHRLLQRAVDITLTAIGLTALAAVTATVIA